MISWNPIWLGLAIWWFTGSAALADDTIRVTTWNMEWFPAGKPTKVAAEIEEQRIQAAANVIEILNPDVLLRQEVRDWETCEKLAKAVKSLRYQVAVVSAFKEFGSVTWQQEAILAKQPAESSWSAPWTTKGTVDPPRGYAFATFRFGGQLVAFYSVHLKSNLIRGGDVAKQAQLNILKRELAASQLMAHVDEIPKKLTGLRSIVVGGDLNTNVDQADFNAEKTLGIFNATGFLNSFGALPLVKRITHPGTAQFPDATFDYIFTKGLKPVGAPEVTPSNLSDHWPVTVELRITR